MSEVLTRVDEGEMVSACCGAGTRLPRDCQEVAHLMFPLAMGKRDKYPICNECDLFTFTVAAINREHQSLQSAVLETAKARRRAEAEFDVNKFIALSLMAAEIAEVVAVDALIAFEAEHGIGGE